MARRNVFPRGRDRSQRRGTSWEPSVGGTAATRFTASSAAFIGSALVPTSTGLTLLRTRGMLSAVMVLSAAAGEGYQGAFGIGLATLDAVTAGIGSVPTPIAQQSNENWLYWSTFSLHVGDELHTRVPPLIEVVDSKAMRKFDDGMAFYAALEVVEIGAATMDVFFDGRMLFALS